jgi:hypothetical protein
MKRGEPANCDVLRIKARLSRVSIIMAYFAFNVEMPARCRFFALRIFAERPAIYDCAANCGDLCVDTEWPAGILSAS